MAYILYCRIEESLSSSANPSDASVEPSSEDMLDISTLRSGYAWRKSSLQPKSKVIDNN